MTDIHAGHCLFYHDIFLFLAGFKVLLTRKAEWAYPVIRKFFKGCPSRNAMFGFAYRGVIHPVTYDTSILLHGDNGL